MRPPAGLVCGSVSTSIDEGGGPTPAPVLSTGPRPLGHWFDVLTDPSAAPRTLQPAKMARGACLAALLALLAIAAAQASVQAHRRGGGEVCRRWRRPCLSLRLAGRLAGARWSLRSQLRVVQGAQDARAAAAGPLEATPPPPPSRRRPSQAWTRRLNGFANGHHIALLESDVCLSSPPACGADAAAASSCAAPAPTHRRQVAAPGCGEEPPPCCGQVASSRCEAPAASVQRPRQAPAAAGRSQVAAPGCGEEPPPRCGQVASPRCEAPASPGCQGGPLPALPRGWLGLGRLRAPAALPARCLTMTARRRRQPRCPSAPPRAPRAGAAAAAASQRAGPHPQRLRVLGAGWRGAERQGCRPRQRHCRLPGARAWVQRVLEWWVLWPCVPL